MTPASPFVVVDREVGPARSHSGCTTGDINGDDLTDMVVLAPGHGVGLYKASLTSPGLTLNQSSMAGAPTGNLSSPFLGDYDNDGDLDLVVLQWSISGAIHLFENNGMGAFTDVTSKRKLGNVLSWGFSGGFADVNDDGWVDLLIAADFGNSKVLLNRQGLWFEDVTDLWNAGTDENGMGSAIGDVDGDGDLDWFITSIYDPFDTCTEFDCNWGGSGNRLYINEGGTQFRDATDEYGVRDGGWGWGASFLDYDNDGDLDLAMTNGMRLADTPLAGMFVADDARLWRNDGAPPMVEVSTETGFVDTRSGKGLTVFDYEHDGDLDVFMVNNADYPSFFKNSSDNHHAWLRVALRGYRSNTQGYGARVYVTPTPDGPTHMYEINGNSNYLSQNEPVAHFGLGTHQGPVAEVRVAWPASGVETILRDVPTRRQIVVHERTTGDLNGDGHIDLQDVSRWLTCQSNGTVQDVDCTAADANADGEVDLRDWPLLSLLLQTR